MEMEFLHNKKGKICTVLTNRYIFAWYNNAPILIQFHCKSRKPVSKLPQNATNRCSSTDEIRACHYISYADDDVNVFDKFINPTFVWLNGKPVHFDDLADGTELNYDAVFLNEIGFQAILVWQGFKPHSVPVLKPDELILSQSYFKLPIHEISFKDGKSYVHVTIDQEVRKIPFSYNKVLVSGKKLSAESEINNILFTSTLFLVSACNLLPCISSPSYKPRHIYYCFCLSQGYIISTNEAAFKPGNIYILKDGDIIPCEARSRPKIYYDVKFKQRWLDGCVEINMELFGKCYLFPCSCCCKSEVEEGMGHIYIHEHTLCILVTEVILYRKHLLADVADKYLQCQMPVYNNKMKYNGVKDSAHETGQNFESKLEIETACVTEQDHHLSDRNNGRMKSLESMKSYENKVTCERDEVTIKKDQDYKNGCKLIVSHYPHSGAPEITEKEESTKSDSLNSEIKTSFENPSKLDSLYPDNSISQRLKNIHKHQMGNNMHLLSNSLALLTTNVSGDAVLVFSQGIEVVQYRVISDINYIFYDGMWLNLKMAKCPCIVHFDALNSSTTNYFSTLLLWVGKKPWYGGFGENYWYFGCIGIVTQTYPSTVIKTKIRSCPKEFILNGEFRNQVFDINGLPCKQMLKGSILILNIERKTKTSEWKIDYAVVCSNDDYKKLVEELVQSPTNTDNKPGPSDERPQSLINIPSHAKPDNKLHINDENPQSLVNVQILAKTDNMPIISDERYHTIDNIQSLAKPDNNKQSINDERPESVVSIQSHAKTEDMPGINDNWPLSLDSKSKQNIVGSYKVWHKQKNPNVDSSIESFTPGYLTKSDKKKMKPLRKYSVKYFNCFCVAEGSKCAILQTSEYIFIMKKENICLQPELKNKRAALTCLLVKGNDVRLHALKLDHPFEFGTCTITHYGLVAWQGLKASIKDEIEIVTNRNLAAFLTLLELEQSILPLVKSDFSIMFHLERLYLIDSKTKNTNPSVQQNTGILSPKVIQRKSGLPVTQSICIDSAKKDVAKKKKWKKKKSKQDKSKFHQLSCNISLPQQQKTKPDKDITCNLPVSDEKPKYTYTVQGYVHHYEGNEGILAVSNETVMLNDYQTPVLLCYFNKDVAYITKKGHCCKYDHTFVSTLKKFLNDNVILNAEIYPSKKQVLFNLEINFCVALLWKKCLPQDASINCSYPPLHSFLSTPNSKTKEMITGSCKTIHLPPSLVKAPNQNKSGVGKSPKSKGRVNIFYSVEGKVTDFNGEEGILTVPSHYLNMIETVMPSVFCFFNKTVMHTQTQKAKSIKDVKTFIQQITSDASFKAAIYHCKRQIILNKEINFCVSLLWRKGMPKNVAFKCILPLLHLEFYPEVTDTLSGNIKSARSSEAVSTSIIGETKIVQEKALNSLIFDKFLESKSRTNMFYFVEGKVTQFNGNEGILTVPSHYLNMTETVMPSVLCFFNKTVVYSQTKDGKQIKDDAAFIQQIESHASFKATIYHCKSYPILNKDIHFCVLLLWRKKMPNNISLHHILPPLHPDLFSKVTDCLSSNVKSLSLENLKLETKPSSINEKTRVSQSLIEMLKSEKCTFASKLTTLKMNETKENRVITNSKISLGIISPENEDTDYIYYDPEPTIPVSKRVPGDVRPNSLPGTVIELEDNCGKLLTTFQTLLQFSQEKCFLYGISLHSFSLKNILKPGYMVEYEIDSSGDIDEVCIGGGPQQASKDTYEKILSWCEVFGVQNNVKLKLLQQCEWIPSSCDPITVIDTSSPIVTLD